MNPKKAGCCSVCDKPLREVKQVDKNGRAVRLGKKIEKQRMATLAMLDGSTGDASLCDSCELGPENLLEFWLRNQMAHYESSQRPETLEYLREAIHNVPIGVLRVQEV